MIKNFFILTKFHLSFAVSLSALFAYVMAKGEFGIDMLWATVAVLLVALGVSALNQVQEYKSDALMDRTKHRPIASGAWSPMTGTIIAITLVIASLVLIYDLLGLVGFNLFLFAFVWYNIVYTPLKKKSSLAVVPGAILGVIPPAIGWITARLPEDGIATYQSLAEPEFYALGLFYFIWQIPHFWLLVMLFYVDYKDGGYPTAMRLFGKVSLQRITFIWLVMTIQTGIFMVSIFKTDNYIILGLLVATGIFAFISSLVLLSKNFNPKDARKVFMRINLSFLATVILVSTGEYIQFNF